MKRKVFIFALAAFFLAFASGVAVGVAGRRAFQSNRFQSVLVEELDLTPDQRHQIQRIWSDVADNHKPLPMAELQKADTARWQAIDQLLTPRQRSQYVQIQQQFESRMQELEQGNRDRVARAEDQTRQILTPTQREKYEQLLARPTHHLLYYLRTTTQPSTRPITRMP